MIYINNNNMYFCFNYITNFNVREQTIKKNNLLKSYFDELVI